MPDRLLYFDCFSGISGDMAIGALLALGCDGEELRKGIGLLGLEEEFQLEWKRVVKTGITATKFDVKLSDDHHHHHGDHHHRSYKDIVALIEASRLEDRVKGRALSIFGRIADAEGRIHGVSVDEVHFHEVGAVDSIVDVVGISILLEALSPDRVIASPVTLGTGTVKTMHGIYPVPAPATLEILKGAPVESGDVQAELTTPTGAAILAATVEQWGGLPEMEISAIGYGAGTRELPERPNVLRVALGAEARTLVSAGNEHHHHEH